MNIDYNKISIEELDKLFFLHVETFCFICDGDNKQIFLQKCEEDN